jgi:hypothetical protein
MPTDPSEYDITRLDAELKHLQLWKKNATYKAGKFFFLCLCWTLLIGLIVLYEMDPVLHSVNKRDAIKASQFITHYGDKSKVRPLVECGILTSAEIEIIEKQYRKDFDTLYRSQTDAVKDVERVSEYIKSVNDRILGNVDNDRLTAFRYNLFTRYCGVKLPVRYSLLDPLVKE